MALVLAGLVPLVWPRDIAFINDEPLLIASAWSANGDGRLASMGLLGTYGFVYGPAPTWVYQLLLAVSRNLVVVAALHTFLMSVMTAGALWWLSRSLRLWVWFAAVPMLSPYYWFYARVLWDNTFLIPFGALALAGYAAYLHSNRPLGLRVSLAAMATVPLVHLMGLSLVAPLALHMVVFRRRELWYHKFSVATIAAGALLLAWPYWTYLASPRPSSPAVDQAIEGWLFPLFGGRLLTASGLDYFYGQGPVAGRLFSPMASGSSIAHGLLWGGLIVALFLVIGAMRSREWTTRPHVALILLVSLVCQSVIHGVSAKFQHPHYYNGAWIVIVLFAWFGVDFLATRRGVARWSAILATGWLGGVLCVTVGMLAFGLHRSRGTRDVYGPTLANQQQVAQELARYSPTSTLQVHVNMWERFPHALAVLRQLNASRQIDLPRRTLEVRYVSDDPASGAIEMVER